MTQASDCATGSDEIVVTDEMRARHAAWVDEYAAAIFEMWRAEGARSLPSPYTPLLF